MSEEAEVVEAGATEQAADTPAPADQQPQDPMAGIEEVARNGGWVPKDEYKGDPDKWLDAPSFVLKAAEILPHVTRELREARSEIKEVKKDLKEFSKFHSQTAQREYQRALRDIEARLAQAHADNDLQGIMDASDDLAELKAEAKADGHARKGADDPGPSPEFSAWREEHDWYGKDKALSAAFDALCEEVFEEGYTKPKAGLKEATARLKEKFPEKFSKAENPNRKGPAAVEGAGGLPRARGKTRADLPPEAKAQMDKWVKQGLLTEAEYLKDYQW